MNDHRLGDAPIEPEYVDPFTATTKRSSVESGQSSKWTCLFTGTCVDGPLKDRKLSGGHPVYEMSKRLDARTTIIAGEYRFGGHDQWHWWANPHPVEQTIWRAFICWFTSK